MATFLLRPILRPQVLGIGLGLSLATYHTIYQRPLRMDMLSADTSRCNAQTPAVRNGQLTPGAVRQISSGSIIGLCAGLAVSTFSKPLTLILGLLIVGIQWASSYGINVLPYQRLQKHITSIDLRSAVQDNMAFKLSFGSSFAIAAFMHF